MKYQTPKVKSVKIDDVLSRLGPARALLYDPGPTGTASGSASGSGSSSGGSGSGSGSD